jgi:hypothetical protein
MYSLVDGYHTLQRNKSAPFLFRQKEMAAAGYPKMLVTISHIMLCHNSEDPCSYVLGVLKVALLTQQRD